MPRSIGFAYSIAGAAVAALVIVVAGTTVGLPGAAGAAEGAQAEVQIPVTQDTPVSLPWPGTGAASPVPQADGQEVLPSADEQVEYVYVDEPSRGHDDDDDHDEDEDDDRRERRERRDRDDHDDDHNEDDD